MLGEQRFISVGESASTTAAFRTRGQLHVTVVVKATFALVRCLP